MYQFSCFISGPTTSSWLVRAVEEERVVRAAPPPGRNPGLCSPCELTSYICFQGCPSAGGPSREISHTNDPPHIKKPPIHQQALKPSKLKHLRAQEGRAHAAAVHRGTREDESRHLPLVDAPASFFSIQGRKRSEQQMLKHG